MLPGVLLKEFLWKRYLGVELLNHKESKNSYIGQCKMVHTDYTVYAPASIIDSRDPQL